MNITMIKDRQNIKVIVAGDVSSRDGIGVEIYQDNELVIEIFRDDTKNLEKSLFTKKIYHWNW
jgi:hypothetical protein